ncbi:MAG: hypothetical protein ACMG6E_09260 [Candidatus Roizmanbacteria bacterium]
MMDIASKMQRFEFNEDQIDGGVEGICANCEEDMVVAMCHIAECITFGKQIDLETLNIERERQRIVNTFITLLGF